MADHTIYVTSDSFDPLITSAMPGQTIRFETKDRPSATHVVVRPVLFNESLSEQTLSLPIEVPVPTDAAEGDYKLVAHHARGQGDKIYGTIKVVKSS